MENKNSHSYPRLKARELVQKYAELAPELDLKENDFKHPKAERWQEMYAFVVCHFFSLSSEQLLQRPLGDDCPHPEIYEGAKYLCRLARAMQQVMIACYLHDFSMKDVVDPRMDRLEDIMSALLNFWYFRTMRMAFYEQILSEENEIKAKLEILEKEIDDLQRRINSIRATRAEQEPQLKKEEEARDVLQEEFMQLNAEADKKKQAAADQKLILAEKNAQAKELQTKISTMKEEVSELDGKIVQSPERIKRDTEKMETDIQQLKVEQEQRRGRLMELQAQVEGRTAVNGESEHALRLLHSIAEELGKLKVRREELVKLEYEVQEKKETLSELTKEESRLRAGVTNKQDKLTTLGRIHDHKVADLRTTLQDSSSEYQQWNRLRQKEDAETDALEAQSRDVLQQDELKNAQHEASMQRLIDKYTELEEQVDVYHKRLGDAWTRTLAKIQGTHDSR